jgi:large subunit ribosomal protein L25
MKLKFYKRPTEKKSQTAKIRRAGDIPASIYLKGKDAEPIAVRSGEFSSLLRSVVPGRLATTVFTLSDESGKERKAIIKDIQYNVTNYQVIHLDFEELHDGVTVKVKVPIELTGVAESLGVKLGGAIRQVIRGIRVACLPKDIPVCFKLDVRDLVQNQVKRLSDLQFPEQVRPMADLKEVAVVLVKR